VVRSFDHLTHEQAEAYRQRYVAALPALVQRLRVRSARTSGPSLDASMDSVAPLEVWFHQQLFTTDDDGLLDCPSWWLAGTEHRRDFFDRTMPSLPQVRLVDEVAAYLGEVLQQAVPSARWEVYCCDPKLRDMKRHRSMLVGPFGRVSPVNVVYKQALGPIMHSTAFTEPVLHPWMMSKVAAREEASGG
jgi:hypothetical protein